MKKLLLFLLLIPSIAFSQTGGYVISNFASSGNIGTAAATVDIYSRININQTTASITLSVPSPTNKTTKVTEVWIGNVGTASFTLVPGGVIDTATAVVLKWTGADWYVVGKKSSTTITTGNLGETGSSVLTITGGTGAVVGTGTTIQVQQASGSVPGFLSAANWTTFNNKQAALSGTGFVKFSGTTPSYQTTIGISDLSATGTPSSSTYLRGDNTWATVVGGVSSFNSRTGAVVPASGDYTAAQITNAFDVSTTRSGNTIFAGDATGLTTTPSFRSLVYKDLPPEYDPLGQLFTISGTTWNSSGAGINFTQNGSGTYTFGSNKVTISGGTGAITNFQYYSPYQTMLSDDVCTLVYTYGTTNTLGTGIILLKTGASGGMIFQLDASTSSAAKIKVSNLGIDVPLDNNDGTFAVATGDIITLNVTHSKNKYEFSVEVNSSGVKKERTVTYTSQLWNTGDLMPSISKYGYMNLGGTHDITYFGAYGKTPKNTFLLVGDSYLVGYAGNTSSNATTLSSLLEARCNTPVAVYARQGAAMQDVFDQLTEIRALAPKVVYLNCFANSSLLTPSVVFAQMQTIVSTLQGDGIVVIIGKGYPRSVGFANTVTFNGLIDANYSSDIVVDNFTPRVDAAGTSYNTKYSDGSHDNFEGNKLHAELVWAKAKQYLKPRSNYESQSLYFNQRYSRTTLNGYPNFINDVSSAGISTTGAITAPQTVIQFATNPRLSGIRNGIASIKYTTQNEFINIIGIDEIANTITCIRGQCGTTAQSTAGVAGVQMISSMLCDATGPLMYFEQRSIAVVNGIGSFQNTHTFYTTGGGSNGLAVVNSATNGSAFALLSRQSTTGNAAVRFMTGTANTCDIIVQNTSDMSIGRTSNTDLYMSGGNFGLGSSTFTYRNTNAGADVTSFLTIDAARSITSGLGYAFSSDGLVLTLANGTRRISGAAFKLINTTTTAGSEAADLGIYTQSAGGGDALRASFNANGINTTLGASWGYVAKTTTYAIALTDYTIDCTSGTFTTTLPTAVGNAGKVFSIINSGTGTITIATTSSQTIGGAASTTKILNTQDSGFNLQSDGANWKIISKW